MLPNDPSDWIVIRRSRDRTPIAEAALVLSAVDIDNRIEHHERQWLLLVPEQHASSAESQLDDYVEENRPSIEFKPRVITFDSGWAGVAGYLCVIWLLPSLETLAVLDWNWREIGAMQAGLVTSGEWWRTITALTLHGDLGHIVANSFFGAIFGLFVGRYLGSGFGWLLVLLGGAFGNYLNAWMQAPGFVSIGASTATFAALGLSGAFIWRRGYHRGGGWRRSFAPLFAAIALLAYTGVGGERTDVLAHFTGFACGVTLGMLAASFDIRRLGHSGQFIAGGLALWCVLYAWISAGSAA